MTKTRWLIAAAVFHVAVTLSVLLLGQFHILPNVFDEFGTGVGFAVDGLPYRDLASEIAVRWHTEGIGVWLHTPAPLHLRLYTLSIHFLGPLVGYNILAAEPFNLLFYLCILSLVYLLGKVLFDERVGLISAIVVGVFPSFLIHSTQLLRDPLAIISILTLVLILSLLLTQVLTIKQMLIASLAGVITLAVFWITRANMWNMVIVIQLISILLLAIRFVRERRVNWNLAVPLVLIAASLVIPDRIQSMTLGAGRPPRSPLAISRAASEPRNVWQRLINQAGNRRAAFNVYGPQGSNIDADVRLDSTSAFLRFLPRATVIGVFAPFPKMWLQSGAAGRGGRLLSRGETVLMYLCYGLSLWCLWYERRKSAVWLLFLTALAGMISLGLVVANVGALYRLRYVFWLLLIPLGINGAIILWRSLRLRGERTTSQSS